MKKRHKYLDNEYFLQKIIEYHESGEISDELWLCFNKLCEHYGRIPSFRNYSYIEDMKTEALMRCIRYIDSFDYKTKKNPFSYFTSVVHNSFIGFLNREKIYQRKKWREFKRLYDEFVNEYNIVIKIPDDINEKINEALQPARVK